MKRKYIKLGSLILVGALGFGLSACKDKQKTVAPVTVQFKKEGELTLYKAQTDSIIKQLDIEIADTDYDVQTGLMYRNSMQDDRGMLFIFPTMQPRYFYMKNTRIPLDIIYLDSDQKIVSFQENAQPFDETSLPSEAPAQYVLEVNAGLVEQWRLAVGDSMQYSKTNN